MPQQTATPSSSYDDDVQKVVSGYDADVQAAQAAVTKGEAVPHPIVQRLLSWLPTVEGIVGAGVGAAGGPVGSVLGAGLGGAAGEAHRQLVNRVVGNPAPQTATEAGQGMETAAKGQMIGTAVGLGLGAVAAPAARYLKGKAAETMIAALGPAGRGTGPAGSEALATAKQVAPRLVKEGFMASSHAAALEKVGTAISAADQHIDDVMQALPAGTQVQTGPIVTALERLKQAATVKGVPVGAGSLTTEVLTAVQDQLKAIGPTMTPDEAVHFRQLIGPLAKWSSLAPATENVKTEAYQAAYNGVRSAIESLDPNIAQANQDIHFWLNVKKVLDKAVQRPQAPSSGTSGALLGAAAEAGAHGGSGGILSAAVIGRYVQRAMRSPGWRFASAITKDRIASAILSGQPTNLIRVLSQVAAGTVTPQDQGTGAMPPNEDKQP